MPTLKALPSRLATHGVKTGSRMSEDEFIEWSGDEVRAEWVDGEVVIMNAVAADHADLTMFIILLVGGFVNENDLGKTWAEPFQVRLPKQRRRRSPDLFYAANERMHLLEKTQFNGSPDLIVEVISPDSKTRDRREKFLEYQNAGVLEYWLADPQSRTFEAYTLGTTGKYELIPLRDGQMHSVVLKGLFFQKEWVWQLKFPKPMALIQQMTRYRKKLSSTRRA
jgi:Uma2 family endonuclease